MPAFQSWEIKPGFACDTTGNVTDPAKATVVAVPPTNDGSLPWGAGWLSFGSDFGTVKLRVATNDENGWSVNTITVDPTKGRGATATALGKGVGKISVSRIPTSTTDTADATPVSMVLELGYRG